MVLIEFFDKEPMNNMIGCLSLRPQKVYFVGGDARRIKKQLPKYSEFLSRRGIDTQFYVKCAAKNNMGAMLSVLEKIVEAEQECCFDLTGGGDVALVAVGVIYERYRDSRDLTLHRYNISTHSVGLFETDDGEIPQLNTSMPSITIEESVSLHGGAVCMAQENGRRCDGWDFNDEFICDVDTLWNISKKSPSSWNSAVGALSALEAAKLPKSSNGLIKADVTINKSASQAVSLLEALAEYGLIHEFEKDGTTVSYRYKNSQIKKCLSKAGNVLELKTLILARRLKNSDGSNYYTDSAMQVCIDWDGNVNQSGDGKRDTENEIDVVFMKNLVPVFVSCKNGSVGDDELYKLNTVALRFGGSYVKKVLVATHLGKQGEAAKYFRQRAQDMNICLIDNVHLIKEENFEQKLMNIVM